MDEKKEEFDALMQQVNEGKYDGNGPDNVAEPGKHEDDGSGIDG